MIPIHPVVFLPLGEGISRGISANSMAIDEYSHRVGLKPYALEYLHNLKAKGVKLAVATGLPKELYEPALKNNDIFDIFHSISSTDEVKRGKTFPDVFLLAMQKLELKPCECVAFEDVPQGIASAKKAGLTVYGVHDKYSEDFKAEIEKVADGYLMDFSEAPLSTILGC